MDWSKVKAVIDWPEPSTIKELQRFLGFANFYRRFIRNYSILASPLTAKKLSSSESARKAFEKLKNSFTTAPILCHPDHDTPFVVEVDASSSGIRAVLSQRQEYMGKLHPCALFSRKLTPAEANYVVGNRELLSIKAALEEWHHWLEGARHPFLVITDHRTTHLSCSSRQLPEGLLEPFHIPQRSWSHIAIDFITDLPSSQGFTTVMFTIDRFSKACKLIPLKGLPTAFEMATTLFHHVFRNYGLPEDIVSDQGPQFTSRVWTAFCKSLGISVSVSSGYYPQSNGQVEQLNQEIGRFLQTYCSSEQHRWSEFLPWAEYVQNSLIH
ncbi:hypothetical protein QTP70_006807 [Hemibagrus guttatus]|uniref:Integrase catalytic domain-containing protein n=1 Tax=Hemibagrus guttatus TaxID=175788 RepID=A0AAE0PX42_9TELE|nr:hypothetical protein QTP70_006807 [Hemibagrus guttatus]